MTIKNQLNFSFSDLIAGYIRRVDFSEVFSLRIENFRRVDFSEVFDSQGEIELETSDGRFYTVKVTAACYAELVRNLGEPFQVAPELKDILVEGRFLHAYGLFYPESDRLKFEAKHLLLFGRDKNDL